MRSFSGSFIPTTYIWDLAQVQEVDINSPEFRELLVRLYQNLNEIALNLNIKDTGYYTADAFTNGQLFLKDPTIAGNPQEGLYRQVVRKVILVGPLLNTAEKIIPHGIVVTSTTVFTRIYGTANDRVGNNYIPLPYSSPTALSAAIELRADATNVYVRTGSNRINFTNCYVILEWIIN